MSKIIHWLFAATYSTTLPIACIEAVDEIIFKVWSMDYDVWVFVVQLDLTEK